LLNRRTATLNLFVLYDNETNYTDKAFFYFKIFQHNSKAGLCPLWRTQKTPFDVIYCLYKMKQFHWLLCVAKNCDWPRKITPLSNLTRASLLVEWNLQRKQNWTVKSTNLTENAGKAKSVFVMRASPVSQKPWTLSWSWKNTLRKLAVADNLEAIRFEFWMKGVLVTMEICVLCGWWFSNQFEIVSETPFSCNAVGREL